ncbi:atos homolog protein A isoform X2 [Anabrus simplex]
MRSVMEVEDGLEPHDVFVDLGVLIVEGRIPGGAWSTGRGYGEGPHCAGVGLPTGAAARHDCDPSNNFLCKRAENFRKHMELLWQNSIPMCIEVLLCPDCPCGVQKAQSSEVANIPTPADLLLEQWMITVVSKRCPEAPQISVRGLFQAVRSQLHFSQLSAWWSSSQGVSPAHVSYRVTVPGEAFASQFQRTAVEHSFPVAVVARNTAIKVLVRTLPRMDAVPILACATHPSGEQKILGKNSETGPLPGTAGDVKPTLEEAGRWGTCSERGTSDSLLGASLLDPPQSMDLFGRRYQSPSRGCSPSMEAPERLMCGRGSAKQSVCCGRGLLPRWRDESPPSPPTSSQHERRLGRQGQARRRDCSTATGATMPTDCSQDVAPSTSSCFLPGVVDDRMQNPCNRPGKHHCRCAYDDDSETLSWETSMKDANHRRSTEKHSLHSSTFWKLPSSTTPILPCSVSTGGKEALPTLPSCSSRASGTEKLKATTPGKANKKTVVGGEERAKFNLELSRREFEEVLAVLRNRNAPSKPLTQGAAKEVDRVLSPDLDHLSSKLCCDAIPSPRHFDKSNIKNQCINTVQTTSSDATRISGSSYKADLLLDAILRTSSHGNDQKVFKKGELCDSPNLLTKCKQRHVHDELLASDNSSKSDKSNGDSTLSNSFKITSGNERTSNDSPRVSDCTIKDRTRTNCVTASLPAVVKEKQKTNIFLHTATSEGNISTFLPKATSFSESKSSYSDINTNPDPKCLSLSSSLSSFSPVKVVQLSKEDECKVPSDLELRTNGVKSRVSCKSLIAPQLQIPVLGQPKDDLDKDIENGEVSSSERPVPSALDKAKFRRSLGSAASMVFHSRTGLPLTSSPAPVRRGTSCFDFDSSLNSVSAIRSALFESSTGTVLEDSLSLSSDDTESDGSARSPCSPGAGLVFPAIGYIPWATYCYNLSPSASLLGSFEESVLNGRLEPVSTVQGFTADLGASGSFCPRHLVLPVTVFFYTLGDNDKVSTPYLGHINLGKKGYCVPRSGTIQVTLFNPLGTVVKMFVVMYDLTDMPANSQTFLRQRTLYMPANPSSSDGQPDNPQKYLRYLIHLRFLSSKSGRIFLHTDIRMIIFRKSDFDTATAHGLDMSYELRSFTHGPTNPKFSPRK